MAEKLDKALKYSGKWLEIIKQKELPNNKLAEWIIDESINNFSNHFNKGWLKYRKSVTEAGKWASVEWSGKGAIFQDVKGKEYIDFLGGYGLMSFGWSHPDIVSAVQAQLLSNPMPSQELIDPLRGALTKILSEILPGKLQYSFIAGSGTEANEGAIKLAKMYTKKDAFIVAVNAFHGKTMGSLSMMGKASYRSPVGQLYGGDVYYVPFGDATAVENQLEICKKIGIGVAAVLMEPIQGEAGAIVPPDDYFPRIRAATKKHKVLLIIDEVQTGLGRTGKLFGINHWDVKPDIITMGKALGGGVMPVSAFSSTKEIWECMMEPNPFIHTTTTGGGALACSAAIASINVLLRDNLAGQAEEKGKYMMERLQKLSEKYDSIYEGVSGKGLLIGQHFKEAEVGYKVAAGLFKRGVLVAGSLINATNIRIEPPLLISYPEIDEGLNRLEDTLKEVSKSIGIK